MWESLSVFSFRNGLKGISDALILKSVSCVIYFSVHEQINNRTFVLSLLNPVRERERTHSAEALKRCSEWKNPNWQLISFCTQSVYCEFVPVSHHRMRCMVYITECMVYITCSSLHQIIRMFLECDGSLLLIWVQTWIIRICSDLEETRLSLFYSESHSVSLLNLFC